VIIDEERLVAAADLEHDLRESILHELTHIDVGHDEDHSHLFHLILNEAREVPARDRDADVGRV
jgi:hypothetical protein